MNYEVGPTCRRPLNGPHFFYTEPAWRRPLDGVALSGKPRGPGCPQPNPFPEGGRGGTAGRASSGTLRGRQNHPCQPSRSSSSLRPGSSRSNHLRPNIPTQIIRPRKRKRNMFPSIPSQVAERYISAQLDQLNGRRSGLSIVETYRQSGFVETLLFVILSVREGSSRQSHVT